MKLFPLELAKNTNELKKLISENPDLPIVVLAGQDSTDGEHVTYCGDVRFYIHEILDCKVIAWQPLPEPYKESED